MAVYKLINHTTKRIWYTNNEEKKNQLLNKGFNIYGEDKKPTTRKRKETSVNERKAVNKAQPESNI